VRKGHKVEVLREMHETPEWATAHLRSIGGLNLFGEPRFRVVWGWNRFDWVGGKFEDHDASGNLLSQSVRLEWMPLYLNCNRWYCEQWMPAETWGSPDSWYRHTREWGEEGNVPQLGPYPARGNYQLLSVLETPAGEFVPLDRAVLDDIIALLWLAKRLTYQERLALRKTAIETKKRKDLEYAHQFLNEQTMPAFNEKMFVVVP
jgi:hypothetical protein